MRESESREEETERNTEAINKQKETENVAKQK